MLHLACAIAVMALGQADVHDPGALADPVGVNLGAAPDPGPSPARRPRLGFHFELRPRWWLLETGVAMFGFSWVTVGGAALSTEVPTLAIPIGGALYHGGRLLKVSGSVCNDSASSDFGDLCRFGQGLVVFAGILLVLDGLAQLAGIVMAVAGVATHEQAEVPDAPRVWVAPVATKGGAGLAVAGVF
jgi:hypothetical protein